MTSPIQSIHSGMFAIALALACAPAAAAPPHPAGHPVHPGAGHGAWHGPGPRFYGRPHFNPFYALPLPPPPLFYDPSTYYPDYTPYGAYDPSGAYLPPQDAGPTTYIEAPNYVTAPKAVAPQLPLEQRVQRLKAMCDQGLFTAEECAARRQELLNEM